MAAAQLEAARGQIKSRERVRDLAEVYTAKREVDGMLDLVPSMFPSADDPGNTDRTFLEPACGHGNFLEEILVRKLAFVTVRRYGRGERYEHRILRCLASIYGIDLTEDNVAEAQERLRMVVAAHVARDAYEPSGDFVAAMDMILATNIVWGNTLTDAADIELVSYAPGRAGMFLREWSRLDSGAGEPSLFSAPKADQRPVHYSELGAAPGPVEA